MQSTAEQRTRYETPALTKLAPERALEFLRHHAGLGDPGAHDILKLLAATAENSQ